jgi:hypothetical protein
VSLRVGGGDSTCLIGAGTVRQHEVVPCHLRYPLFPLVRHIHVKGVVAMTWGGDC